MNKNENNNGKTNENLENDQVGKDQAGYDDSKELDELIKEHDANDISDREFEAKKKLIANKAKSSSGKSGNEQIKLLKSIRNLLIALVVIISLGFASATAYIIYLNNVEYEDDWYYEDEELYDSETTE